MSDYLVPEKIFPITPALRQWAKDCEEALDYLTQNPGDIAHNIRPITIALNDGKGGTFREQCGMSFGDKGENGQEATFIVGTHTNEMTALKLVNTIRKNYLQHESAMKGNQINLIFGGDPERARELLAILRDPKNTEMTEGDFERYRNTARNVNCNRIDSSAIPFPKAGDVKEWDAWRRAFDRLRNEKPLDTGSPAAEKKWYEALHRYYAGLESGHGTEGWLLQKHFALQKYRDKVDFHTTSRAGDPLTFKYGMHGEPLDDATLRTLARMGTVNVQLPPLEGKYLHMSSSVDTQEKDGMLFECGAHRDIAKSGKAAEKAFYGVIAEKFGLFLDKGMEKPQSVGMTLCTESNMVFPPLSPTSAVMKDEALNIIPEFYLDGKIIPSNDPRIRNGQWGGDGEEKPRFHAISSNDTLPQPIRDALKGEHIPLHDNGSPIHKGDAAFWAAYTLSDGRVIPAIFRSPFDGITFMTPAKGWDDIDGRFSFTEISANEGNKKITVNLPGRMQGRPDVAETAPSSSGKASWREKTARQAEAAQDRYNRL